ncbi:hypothetical protein EYC80_002136 [Monilinia laxa]|uniref:Uncharacterized protein n=1 Tax=Monilinia laxa TaxID=61186 RepID=A0A5N6K311_MONLA|nr:hypothetical protein EYC80_002136 [Monilinia laxa]
MQERDLSSSQPRPGRHLEYTSTAKSLNQMHKRQALQNDPISTRNIASVPNKLATFTDAKKVRRYRNCTFMQQLSIDVRSQIYSYLLMNPMLSTLEAVGKDTDFGVKQKYELHPSILRTCKRVYQEASAVLYGLNTFYMVAMKSSRMFRFTLADFNGSSALTRYWRENADVFNVAPEAGLYLCKVRQWKVEISYYGSPDQADIELPVVSIKSPVEYGMTQHLSIDPRTGIPPPSGRHRRRNQYIVRLGVQEARDTIKQDMVSFLRPLLGYSMVPFCHLISLCEVPPHKMEIIIKPQVGGEVPRRSEYLGLVPTEDEELRLIKPLEMLRGVQMMKFTHGESSDGDKLPTDISCRYIARESELKQLVTCREKYWPVECPSKMYANLLSYAQAFERYEPFKQRMAANWLYQNSYMNTPNPYKTQSPNPIQYSNPFGPHNNKYKSHPVTRHLSSAASAVRTHDVVAMMGERKTVVDYLESQYRRMVCESEKFGEFVDKQNKRYGVWDGIVRLQCEINRYAETMRTDTDPGNKEVLKQDFIQRLKHRIRSIDFTEALVVLEEYAKAFNRDIPHETRKQIARVRFEYEGHYNIMEREVAIRKLQQMVVDIPKSLDDAAVRFKELYMIAANDMQKQYLEIREARKRLFEDEVVGDVWECPIDLQMELDDRKIDWKVPREDPSFTDKFRKSKECRELNPE